MSPDQQALNLLIQFLYLLCDFEDQIAQKLILNDDPLFDSLQLVNITLSEAEQALNLAENLNRGYHTILNVFEMQRTPLSHYMDNYSKVCKYVQQDLLQQISSTDCGHLKFIFFEIMSKKGSALLKQVINKLDSTFTLAKIEY